MAKEKKVVKKSKEVKKEEEKEKAKQNKNTKKIDTKKKKEESSKQKVKQDTKKKKEESPKQTVKQDIVVKEKEKENVWYYALLIVLGIILVSIIFWLVFHFREEAKKDFGFRNVFNDYKIIMEEREVKDKFSGYLLGNKAKSAFKDLAKEYKTIKNYEEKYKINNEIKCKANEPIQVETAKLKDLETNYKLKYEENIKLKDAYRYELTCKSYLNKEEKTKIVYEVLIGKVNDDWYFLNSSEIEKDS